MNGERIAHCKAGPGVHLLPMVSRARLSEFVEVVLPSYLHFEILAK